MKLMEAKTNNTVISKNLVFVDYKKKIMENVFQTLAVAFAPTDAAVAEMKKEIKVEFSDDNIELQEESSGRYTYTNGDLYLSFGDFGAVFEVDAEWEDVSIRSSVYLDPSELDARTSYDIRLLSVIDDCDNEIEVSKALWKEIEEKGERYILNQLDF